MKGRTIAVLILVSCPVPATVHAQGANAKAAPVVPTVEATGERLRGLEHFDRDMIAFMRQNGISGASMAVVKNGHLVYARSFGYADADRKEPVRPTSLFRVASISKMITAVTILHLIEQGKLRRDDRIFDLLKLEAKAKGTKVDPRWRQITVSHLLRHEGGWDRNKSGDPFETGGDVLKSLHASPPLTADLMIRYMLARPLDFEPGKDYSYSNFGYCLLGRVVEAVTGRSYEEYVRAEILAPMGISDMRIGKSLLKDRAPGEVRYYQPNEPRMLPSVYGPKLGAMVPSPYGTEPIEVFDACGGWIGSAVDVARLATALDPASSYKALSNRAREAMFRRPPGPGGHEPDGKPKVVYYAYGMLVRPLAGEDTYNAWHAGSLWGSSSCVVRRHDGVNAAILFNKREDDSGKILAMSFVDDHLHNLIDSVPVWYRGNLFPKFTVIQAAPKPKATGPAPAAVPK